MPELLAYLRRLADDPSAGWVVLTGQVKPLDLSAAARKLLADMDDTNPLVDHDAAVCRAIRFMWSMQGLDSKRRVVSWHPSYAAFLDSKVFEATYVVTARRAA